MTIMKGQTDMKTAEYMIYAVMGIMLAYTIIHYLRLQHKIRRERYKRELIKEYKAVEASMLIQMVCVMLATIILY